MSVHCSLEALSTYVDAELSDRDRQDVESHVDQCDDCRRRLARLQGVVGQLQRLEQIEAPATLGWQVQRRVRLESDYVPLTRRFEDHQGRMLRPPLLAPLFAVVVAFGAILYLFSLGVARQTVSGTEVVVGRAAPPTTIEERSEASQSPGLIVDPPAEDEQRTASLLEKVAEETAEESAVAARRRNLPETVSSLRAAGREFQLAEGVWVELGLGDASPEERIDLATGGALPGELEELSLREGTYRLMMGDRVIEVVVAGREDH
jgi:hypothetical protein